MPSKKLSGPLPRKPIDPRSVTSEDIAAHLVAFAAAGGQIEVLGVTRVLKTLGDGTVSATPPQPRR
jgi:hypothetical protein